MFPLLYVQVRGWNRLFANGSRCVWRGNRSICHQPFLLPSGPIWDWHPGMRSHHNWWMSDWCYEWGIYALKGNKQSKVNDAAYCSGMNEARVGVGQLNSIYQNTESMHRQHHFVFASMWVITSVPHPEPYLSVSKQSEAKSSLWLQRPCLSCKATCRRCSEGLSFNTRHVKIGEKKSVCGFKWLQPEEQELHMWNKWTVSVHSLFTSTSLQDDISCKC